MNGIILNLIYKSNEQCLKSPSARIVSRSLPVVLRSLKKHLRSASAIRDLIISSLKFRSLSFAPRSVSGKKQQNKLRSISEEPERASRRRGSSVTKQIMHDYIAYQFVVQDELARLKIFTETIVPLCEPTRLQAR